MKTDPAPKQQGRSSGAFSKAAHSPAGRRWMLVSASGLVALALLVVMFNIDPENTTDRKTTEDALDEARILFHGLKDPTGPAIPQDLVQNEVVMEGGARIQVADRETGRLVQEYIAARITTPDDNPRLMDLERPQAKFFLRGQETLVLEGDHALARKQESGLLESGTITGHVVVRMFTHEGRSGPDYEHDTPTLVIETSQATFDHLSGEVHCPGKVRVQWGSVLFNGESLTALYDEDHGLQHLLVARATEPMRIASIAFDSPQPDLSSTDERADSTSTTLTSAAPAPVPDRRPTTPRDILRPPGSSQPTTGQPSPQPTRSRQTTPDTPRRTAEHLEQNRSGTSRTDRRSDDEPRPDWLERRRKRAQQRQTQADPQSSGFFKATFADNVRIWREGSDEVMTGDELRLYFSMHDTGFGETLARGLPRLPFGHPAKQRVQAPNRALAADKPLGTRMLDHLVAMTLAVQDGGDDTAYQIIPDLADGDIFISYDGPLIVTPIKGDVPHLATVDDSAVELVGSPVVIDDPAKGAHAVCGSVVYVSSEDRVAFLATPLQPLGFASEGLVANGERFDYLLGENRGAFVGPGNMQLTGSSKEAVLQDSPELQDAVNATRQDEAGDSGGELHIDWTSEVKLIFREDTEDTAEEGEATDTEAQQRSGSLERAIFVGDVKVNEERFNMQSDRLEVVFAAEGTEQDSIEQIIADGNVEVNGLDQKGGHMRGQHLRVDFATNDAGEMLPSEMYASGDALIRDINRSVSADELTATLVEAARVDQEGDPDAQPEPGTFDRVQIDTFLAINNVRVELNNGASATGDRLEGSAANGTADLTGEQVVVEGSENDVDFRSVGTHAKVERLGDRSTITLYGGGNVVLLNRGRRKATEPAENLEPADPVDEGERKEQAAAAKDAEKIDIDWTEQFTYTEGRTEGSGTIEMRGDVHAVSSSPMEQATLDALRVTIDFGQDPAADPGANEEPNRILHNLIARGNAKLEQRVWETPERTEEPRLFYITGQHIEYDQISLESRVYGAGLLLVYDPRPIGPDRTNDQLTGQGTTLFEWLTGMEMKQFVDERYQVVMDGNVKMRHRPLDGPGENAFLVCEHLDLALARRAPEDRQGGLDFGGSTGVERFEARDRVRLVAQGKTFDCRELRYNKAARIVAAFGSPQVDASFRDDRVPGPIFAKEIKWDLATDAVTTYDIRGSIPRGGG